jgi:hypothetical protein
MSRYPGPRRLARSYRRDRAKAKDIAWWPFFRVWIASWRIGVRVGSGEEARSEAFAWTGRHRSWVKKHRAGQP